MEDVIFQKLLGKVGEAFIKESKEVAPVAPPAAEPPKEEIEVSPPVNKAQEISAIIAQAYSMPGVPERTRKRCARYAIEEKFGEEEAKKYLRGNKKKVAVPQATPVEPTPVATQAEPAVTPPAAIASTSEPPKISIDGDLRKLMSSAAASDSAAPVQ